MAQYLEPNHIFMEPPRRVGVLGSQDNLSECTNPETAIAH